MANTQFIILESINMELTGIPLEINPTVLMSFSMFVYVNVQVYKRRSFNMLLVWMMSLLLGVLILPEGLDLKEAVTVSIIYAVAIFGLSLIHI